MIRRLKLKDAISFYDFILRCKDVYEDMYITKNKQRIFFIDLKLIEKILKYQEVYAIEEKEIKAILILVKDKGFRAYIRILVEKKKYIYDLMRFVDWNFNKQEIYLKIKRTNIINNVIFKFYDKVKKENVYRYGWQFLGNRGLEVLYVRKPRQEMRYDDYNRKIEKPD